MSIHDYLLEQSPHDWAALLRPWSDLLPREFTVWLVNRFGDVFLVFQDGTVQMLEIGGTGEVKKVAESRDDFGNKIDEGNNANQWLMIPLIDELVAAGHRLSPETCYTYRQPPILGGDYSVENTAIVSIKQHYGFYGDIYQQTKNLRDGTAVVILPKNKLQ